jgi:hypothetical protein
MTANNPKIKGETPLIWKISGRSVAKVPLSKSKIKTAIPAFTPRIRKVLVVPVFPEP